MAVTLRRNKLAFLALIQAVMSYEWISSAWEKFTDPTFISSMGGTVAVFAAKNSNGAVSSLLKNVVEPHAVGFGYMVMYGEMLAGIGLALGALAFLFRFTPDRPRVEVAVFSVSLVAGVGAVIMSATYWEAAGWMSVSTSGLNLVMGLVAAVIVIATVVYLTHLSHERALKDLTTATAIGVRLAEISGRRQTVTTRSATGQSASASPQLVHS